VPQAVLFADEVTVSKGMVKYATQITKESIVDVEGLVTLPDKPIEGCSQKDVRRAEQPARSYLRSACRGVLLGAERLERGSVERGQPHSRATRGLERHRACGVQGASSAASEAAVTAWRSLRAAPDIDGEDERTRGLRAAASEAMLPAIRLHRLARCHRCGTGGAAGRVSIHTQALHSCLAAATRLTFLICATGGAAGHGHPRREPRRRAAL
jgi:hypothetical protein